MVVNPNTPSIEDASPMDDAQSLLPDAFDAPQVPASLLRKIDQGIELQWGKSIEPPQATMFDTSKLKTLTSSPRAKYLLRRAVAATAALVAAIFLGFYIFGGSTAYAWADVLKAIAGQPAVQIETESGGEDAGDVPVTYVTQRTTASGERVPPFLRLLLRTASPDGYVSTDGLRVKDEGWRRSGDEILLNIAVENNLDERYRFELSLDPATSLPKAAKFLDQDQNSRSSHQKMVVSYPTLASISRDSIDIDSVAVTERVKPSVDPLSESVIAANPLVDSVDDTPVDNAVSSEKVNDIVRSSLPLGTTPQWPSVAVVHRSPAEVRQFVDKTLEQVWQENNVDPVSRADDSELLRRVYLDIAGRAPSVTEARQYLNDTDPDRYQKLVQRLLASSEHASHLATTWRTFLIPEGVDLENFGGREAFDKWLAGRFEAGEPYDAIVRQLLLAEGRLSKSGPLLFYSAAKLDPDRLAGQTSRVFLGIRLECAQCHDHPFEPWSQKDFWRYAAFFARISRPQAELETVSSVMQVRDVDRGEVMLPETDQVIPPRFLGESDDSADIESDKSVARRERLAVWLTSPKNPYFARATVNRLWSLMFGRGIVDPVDDFGENNPPLSPELLDALASQLIDSNFDLRTVMQTIALSRAYQLSSAGASDDSLTASRRRLTNFAQMDVKTLTAAQLYDCVTVATLPDQNQSDAAGFQLNRFGNSGREAFLRQFASPAGNRIEYNAGIPQALTLMNGELIDSATGISSSGLLKSLDAPFFTDEQRIEVLFLATLSRMPNDSERELFRSAIPEGATAEVRTEVLSDILWALLNSAEFSLNN